MKIVFLDIDGVLNSARNCHRQYGRPRPFDPDAICALNQILTTTGAHIVLSSTWRIGMTVAQIEEMLMLEGVVPGRVVDKTPFEPEGDGKKTSRPRPRREEIAAWLAAHPEVEAFVTLDDDEDAGPDHFVICDEAEGLTIEAARRAIEILSQAKPDAKER